MKVYITSKIAFDDMMKRKGITNDNVEEYKNTFFISINDSFGTDEKPYFENKENVKVLFFDDVEKDLEVPIIGTKEVQIAKAFTIMQANELLEFIDKHKDKKSCIVHCAAGISRSGAVGTFINEYLGGNWFEFKKTNPRIHPNGLVLRMLKCAVAEKYKSGVIGYDTSGQPIIPVRDKLVVKKNAHPNCDGTAWGWIEGCSLNICWSDENTRFNRQKADELVRQYNDRCL